MSTTQQPDWADELARKILQPYTLDQEGVRVVATAEDVAHAATLIRGEFEKEPVRWRGSDSVPIGIFPCVAAYARVYLPASGRMEDGRFYVDGAQWPRPFTHWMPLTPVPLPNDTVMEPQKGKAS